ncbi:MAG: TIGR03084 family metal-binding protein [Ilumatobacteraceae bacterium]|nr:MAG: TIGR03084 family protein [Actinomycetota bacterium]
MELNEVLDDLAAEQESLDSVVAKLAEDEWARPTPSPRWTVADQIAHLAYFDGSAALAITDPDAFAASVAELIGSLSGGEEAVDEATLGPSRKMSPDELLAHWRANRRRLYEAAQGLDENQRVPWYGPSMSAKSFLTARLMEAWAHGTDVVDTVGAERPATDRLRHIAQLGFITRGWSYANRGEEVPSGTVRLELTAPSGETWTWGPDPADDAVTGTALDFCLVVTQRRHLDDTALLSGELGRHWLVRAQAFAGGATDGPAPRVS